MARFSSILTRFMSDRRGNFAILTGATLSMLAVGAGFGVNTAQLMNTKSALQNALDAAVASTARDLTTGVIAEADARASIEAFLIANGGGAFAREGAVTLETLTVDRVARTVEATAKANIDLAFPLFGAEKTRDVAATTAALYSDRQIEVAMMLDVTGSMGNPNPQKIKDLRAAATKAVDDLLGGQDRRNPRVRVAIVPYAQAVNVGNLAATVVFQEDSKGGNLPPYIGASRRYISDNTGSYSDTCATERKMPDLSPDYSADGPLTIRHYPGDASKRYYARVNRDDRLAGCPQAKIVPLTADAASLKRSIAAFSADGFTAGAIGIQWTNYMLSSQWRDAIRNAGMGDGPADFDPDEVKKIAILMTDGQFNTAYAGDNPRNKVTAQDPVSRANAEALCGEMKVNGIEIFTIGFDLDNRSMTAQQKRDAKDVLKACSSDDTGGIKHYYEASTGPELNSAFQEIIRNTESLFLTM